MEMLQSDKTKIVAEDVAEEILKNTKYLSEQLGVVRKTIQRDLKGLVEAGLVEWIGTAKNGHWQIATT